MYVALNYWVFGGFDGKKSAREFIDWAAAKGLDGVELTIGDCLKLETPENEAKEIAAYARERKVGLRTAAFGGGWGKWLCADDPAERKEAINATRRALQLVSWLGAETLLVVPGATRVAWDPSHAEVSYAHAWKNATEAIRALEEDAERLGVNLALENVWNRFLLSPMEWKVFLDQFASKRIGIYFDVGNASVLCRPEDYPEILGDRIKGVHLKNFSETDCAGGLHGFGDDLFTGVVRWEKVFAALSKIGYAGPMTVEMIPFSRLPDLVLPDEALADKMCEQINKLKEIRS